LAQYWSFDFAIYDALAISTTGLWQDKVAAYREWEYMLVSEAAYTFRQPPLSAVDAMPDGRVIDFRGHRL
jgi:hypothetical protein